MTARPVEDPAPRTYDQRESFDWSCDRCGEPHRLFARVRGGKAGPDLICATCWKAAGCPWPSPGDVMERHQAEVATRERMNRRGGADRHLVRKGVA